VKSGGTAVLSVDPNSAVTINFNGTGIKWIGYRDEWFGIAKLYLDGSVKDLVDTYSSPEQSQATIYSIDGLAPGNHSLTITATGTHGPSSHGAWIWVDAFDVTGQ
jgi:hypothetical protein